MKRDDFTLSLPLGHELIIDNFASGGGISTGLEAAFGRAVDIAINHAPTALAMFTITAASSNQQQVTAYLVTYYGNEKDGVSVGEPMHTLPTKDRMGLVQIIQLPANALTRQSRQLLPNSNGVDAT